MAVNLKESPIFVIGPERSGTTMVMALLGTHSRIAVPEVAWWYPRFQPYLHTFGDLSDDVNFKQLAEEMIHSLIIPYWGMNLNPITAVDLMMDKAKEKSFAGLYDALHTIYAERNGNKPRWGQKTPHNTFFVEDILKDFPNAQFVFVTRDGRDTIADHIKSNFGPNNAYVASVDWNCHLEAAEKARKIVPTGQWYDIKYEDVCRNPEEELRKLCEYLGEEYEPTMQDFWKGGISQRRKNSKDHAPLGHAISDKYIGIYKHYLSERDLQIFACYAGGTHKRAGYECDTTPLQLTPEEEHKYEDFDGRMRAAVLDTSGIYSTECYNNWMEDQRIIRANLGIWDPETTTAPYPVGDKFESFITGRKISRKYMEQFELKPRYSNSFMKMFANKK